MILQGQPVLSYSVESVRFGAQAVAERFRMV